MTNRLTGSQSDDLTAREGVKDDLLICPILWASYRPVRNVILLAGSNTVMFCSICEGRTMVDIDIVLFEGLPDEP